ncbi:DNA polymerase IV [Clostridium sartagoforme]|uniref:DNA polymerase IV n=1 Tax=Clostridium sartagoforme TaxID=84031 RepID=A0A4S2DPS1_9CLOT|nr:MULTISPECIES: DNA polymerase IV [Clostridium]MBS5937399.1 DNA polymerase IV [Clostridium sp.]TGY43822.1 DNA polymerase IV [Clostridium sartagoforme]
MERIILHVDMDAFFASVEQLDNKALRGKPVIVGGVSERGVVSTCSYEARKYGVHSAMPVFIARKLCPHGIFVRTRFYRYKEISNKVFNILRDVTSIIEPLSIDEAYLDITNSKFKSGLEAAKYIKYRVLKEVGLTISVGISYNKFLAKLASDWNKPNGIMIIDKEMMPDLLMPFPISKIYGLGKKSVEKLNNMGIFIVKDLYEMPKEFYIEYLGKYGLEIYDRIRGIDNREVVPVRDRKSFGKETTLKADTNDKEELLSYLKEFSKEISNYLINKNIYGKTITVKYKTESFVNHTRSKTLNYYTNDFNEIYSTCEEIIENENIKENIRLIGVTISSFKENTIEQLTLF